MKRIFTIFHRDLSNSLRDYLFVYMLIAPLLLTVGFKFFIPSAQSTTLQFAIDQHIESKVIAEFRKYGNVEVFSSKDHVIERVRSFDDVAGISQNKAGNYQVILEGNESHDTKEIPHMILRDILKNKYFDINYKMSDLGFEQFPLVTIGTTSLIIISILIGGVIIGLNIIEEKETNTLKALNVTPMRKWEFILGRSTIGVVFPIFHVYTILWILGMFPSVNKVMIGTITIVSSLLAILIGFFVGIMSNNQISGIANLKGVFMIVSAAIVGAILLPESKHFFLYWAPPYWVYISFRDILLNTITWSQLGMYIIWILGLTVIVFSLLKNKIKKGLI